EESVYIFRILFSGLTKPGEDLSPTPDLAEDWDVSDDGLEWTFHLRDDVTWHDGEPFTSEDVAHTFNEIVLDDSLAANNASNYQMVEEVEAIDETTVVFKLESPNSALPAYLSYNSGILPK